MSSPSTDPAPRIRYTTRSRILEAARQELGRDPDCSLGGIAEAAGVSRRTVYLYFAGRTALLSGLVEEVEEAVRRAIDTASPPDPGAAPGPVDALARFVLALWPVGDCYRMLIGLAGQDLGPDRTREVLAPARERVAGILAEGQRQGVFHTAVPPGPLSSAVEAHLLALLGAVNSGMWTDDGTGTAVAALVAAGVDSTTATFVVRGLHGTEPIPSPHRPR
ncbi:MAG TPA: TetR/AcrR family transcriptional regulator [Streptomyces sp.]